MDKDLLELLKKLFNKVQEYTIVEKLEQGIAYEKILESLMEGESLDDKI